MTDSHEKELLPWEDGWDDQPDKSGVMDVPYIIAGRIRDHIFGKSEKADPRVFDMDYDEEPSITEYPLVAIEKLAGAVRRGARYLFRSPDSQK